jgi:uncharacterized cupredoxin-like copper-binding protein
MKRLGSILAAAFVLAAPVAAPGAQQPDWNRAPLVEVALANFKFTPRTIRLRAGQPVRLHLVNRSGGGHDFTAREFFAAASVRPQDRGAIIDGSVEVRGRQGREIALVPRAGRYKLKCTHTLHKTLGMSGVILVD